MLSAAIAHAIPAPVLGWKLLRAGESLCDPDERVYHPHGDWVEVRGRGIEVAPDQGDRIGTTAWCLLKDAVFPRDTLVELECCSPTGARADNGYTRYAQVRVRRVFDIFSQWALGDIARTAGNAIVREAAVERIDDQAVLTRVARHDWDASVRKAAVERLTDRAELVRAVRSDKDANVVRAALKRIGWMP